MLKINPKELLNSIHSLARIKNLDEQQVINALVVGIQTSIRRDLPEGALVHVEVNEDDNKEMSVQFFRMFELCEQIENIEREMLFSEVEDDEIMLWTEPPSSLNPNPSEKEYAFEELQIDFDRKKVNIIKQVAQQHLKQMSLNSFIEDEIQRQGYNLFIANVLGKKRDMIRLDFMGYDINMHTSQLIGREFLDKNSRILFTFIKENGRYVPSRVSNQFLEELIKSENSSVLNKNNADSAFVRIVDVARIPGVRAKVTVAPVSENSKQLKSDIIRDVIGYGGAVVKYLATQVNGEFIEFLVHNSDLPEFLGDYFSKYNLLRIMIDETEKSIFLCFDDESYDRFESRASVELALLKDLIHHDVTVLNEDQWNENAYLEQQNTISLFTIALDCSTSEAIALFENGFNSLDELAYLDLTQFEFDGIDDSTLGTLQSKAKMVVQANPNVSDNITNLLNLGLSQDNVIKLFQHFIYSAHSLADLSTDELLDILPHSNKEECGKIIIKARKFTHLI